MGMSFRVVMASTKLLFCVLILSVGGTAAQTGRSLRGGTAAQMGRSLQDATTPQNRTCHDTKEGESCYAAVMWAMEHGIVMHPEWYPGLHVGSSFAEFQAHMDNIGHGGCEDPCDICETSKSGKQCYEAVTWAMEHGITLQPETYGNLTSGSTFEEFQRFFYFEGLGGCAWPCARCHTAVPDETCYTAVEGEPCYEGVMWEMEYGISLHPEWYPELTTNSSFEDVQAHLHEGNYNQCPEPCRQ